MYLARCEGLTLAEWCKEQDVRTERALERERFKITERVKRAEKEAEDPRPDRKQFRDAEVALVAKRCGAGAMRKARNRLGKSMKPSRRARDASSVLGMMLLRSRLRCWRFRCRNHRRSHDHQTWCFTKGR